ncbi:hypothetical protein HN51_036880, partial [Arachis hypogaea]
LAVRFAAVVVELDWWWLDCVSVNLRLSFARLSGSASLSLVLWLSLSISGIWIAAALLLPFTGSS